MATGTRILQNGVCSLNRLLFPGRPSATCVRHSTIDGWSSALRHHSLLRRRRESKRLFRLRGWTPCERSYAAEEVCGELALTHVLDASTRNHLVTEGNGSNGRLQKGVKLELIVSDRQVDKGPLETKSEVGHVISLDLGEVLRLPPSAGFSKPGQTGLAMG